MKREKTEAYKNCIVCGNLFYIHRARKKCDFCLIKEKNEIAKKAKRVRTK